MRLVHAAADGTVSIAGLGSETWGTQIYSVNVSRDLGPGRFESLVNHVSRNSTD